MLTVGMLKKNCKSCAVTFDCGSVLRFHICEACCCMRRKGCLLRRVWVSAWRSAGFAFAVEDFVEDTAQGEGAGVPFAGVGAGGLEQFVGEIEGGKNSHAE